MEHVIGWIGVEIRVPNRVVDFDDSASLLQFCVEGVEAVERA